MVNKFIPVLHLNFNMLYTLYACAFFWADNFPCLVFHLFGPIPSMAHLVFTSICECNLIGFPDNNLN